MDLGTDLQTVTISERTVGSLFEVDPLWRTVPVLPALGGSGKRHSLSPLRSFLDMGSGEPLLADALQTEFGDAKRILALDLKTLRRGTEQVEEVVAQDGLMTALTPVHYETLATPEST